jgi:hypothetical protein
MRGEEIMVDEWALSYGRTETWWSAKRPVLSVVLTIRSPERPWSNDIQGCFSYAGPAFCNIWDGVGTKHLGCVCFCYSRIWPDMRYISTCYDAMTLSRWYQCCASFRKWSNDPSNWRVYADIYWRYAVYRDTNVKRPLCNIFLDEEREPAKRLRWWIRWQLFWGHRFLQLEVEMTALWNNYLTA